MNIAVIFGPAYAGSISDAAWIIDTPGNRAWFEQNMALLDPNSAVFNAASDPLSILWAVFEHHPAWTEIVVTGEPMTPEIAWSVVDQATTYRETSDGIHLKRLR